MQPQLEFMQDKDSTIQPQESRIKKSLLNARVNLIFYFLILALGFFSRKIFLDTLGAAFIGLTGTLFNLLGFLNLAELGIGGAIGYLLYKPIYEKDHNSINEIISVMGWLYRWIGTIILTCGIILSFLLPWIFPDKDTGFSLPLIYFAYYAFLGSSLIGYFINYRQNLLGADQKNYVVTGYFQTINIVKTLIQMALAYFTKSYWLWVAIEFIFGITYAIILNWKINQTYPWLKSEIRLGKKLLKKYPQVITKTKQLFVHRIGAFAQFQTIPFLTYAFVSLKYVAYYGNYSLITDKLLNLVSQFLVSTSAGVGNLIAENNRQKIQNVYWELMALRFIIAGCFAFCLYKLVPPFICLWLGQEYLLPTIVLVIIIINFVINIIRGATEQFVYGYGLFQDTWAPIAETVIYVAVAIAGGYLWGLPGILAGSTVSMTIIVLIWKPYFLYTKGFKIPVMNYWKSWILYIAISLGALFFSDFAISHLYNPEPQNTNWLSFLLYSLECLAVCILAMLAVFSIFTSSVKSLFNRITNVLIHKK